MEGKYYIILFAKRKEKYGQKQFYSHGVVLLSNAVYKVATAESSYSRKIRKWDLGRGNAFICSLAKFLSEGI